MINSPIRAVKRNSTVVAIKFKSAYFFNASGIKLGFYCGGIKFFPTPLGKVWETLFFLEEGLFQWLNVLVADATKFTAVAYGFKGDEFAYDVLKNLRMSYCVEIFRTDDDTRRIDRKNFSSSCVRNFSIDQTHHKLVYSVSSFIQNKIDRLSPLAYFKVVLK